MCRYARQSYLILIFIIIDCVMTRLAYQPSTLLASWARWGSRICGGDLLVLRYADMKFVVACKAKHPMSLVGRAGRAKDPIASNLATQ